MQDAASHALPGEFPEALLDPVGDAYFVAARSSDDSNTKVSKRSAFAQAMPRLLFMTYILVMPTPIHI